MEQDDPLVLPGIMQVLLPDLCPDSRHENVLELGSVSGAGHNDIPSEEDKLDPELVAGGSDCEGEGRAEADKHDPAHSILRQLPPALSAAHTALRDIKVVLKPPRPTGSGSVNPNLDLLTRSQLEGMRALLWCYSNVESKSQGAHGSSWMAASLDVAHDNEKGPWYAHRLCEWTKAYIEDHEIIPENIYGTWNVSWVEEDDVAQEIHLHLQSIGQYVRAMDVHYRDQPEVKECLKRKKLYLSQWLSNG